MSTSDKIIMISERVSNDLALRDIADALFDDIESLKESEVVIDFSEVTSITRSFAHQYSLRKKSSKKNISEVNMPANIRKMFDIVENKYEKTKLIEIGSVEPIVVNMPKKAKLCELVSEPKPERTVRPEVREAYIKNFEDRKDLFKKLAKY